MTTLEKAIAWRDKLTKIVPHANDPNYVIEKIEILDYLIEKAKESEIRYKLVSGKVGECGSNAQHQFFGTIKIENSKNSRD